MTILGKSKQPTQNHNLPEEELSLLKQEIERLENALQKVKYPFVPPELSEEEKGKYLLNAFLKDEPFDRYTFALQPIKVSFLNAAFQTHDPEIVTYALNQVKSTLDTAAFNRLLDTSPQFRGAYDYLSHPNKKSKIIYININAPKEKTINDLKKEKENANDLMKLVIDDEIKRLSGKPITGIEEVDLKWKKIGASVNQPQLIKTNDIISKNFIKLLLNKWTLSIDPKQAALVMRSLGYPQEMVMQYARMVSDPKEKKDLEFYGIRV